MLKNKKIIISLLICVLFSPLAVFAQNVDSGNQSLPDAQSAGTGEQDISTGQDQSTNGDYMYCSFKNQNKENRCVPIFESGVIFDSGLSYDDAVAVCNETCAGGQNTACTPVTECVEGYTSKPVKLENPIKITDISIIVGTIIKNGLTVIGALTLVVFVYGGFLWITSAGSEEKVRMGTDAMLYAVIGIFIIFSSYGILNLIFNKLAGG